MRKIGLLLLVLVVLVSFSITGALAQPAAPKGLRIDLEPPTCSLTVVNSTNFNFEVIVNGQKVGELLGKSQFEKKLPCPKEKVNVDLESPGLPGIKITKIFTPAEGGKFIWNVQEKR